MAKESEKNQDSTPLVSRELIVTALEEVETQGHDVNPYSVARQAGVPPEAVFTNSAYMALIIAAREDQATFTIDSHLADRCQEMEGEMFKLMEINQEIYDRALEMEERVIQLEAKITDMEEDAEKLTMQLQNSWHLGYKKGLSDGQSQAAEQTQSGQEQPAAVNASVEEDRPKEVKLLAQTATEAAAPKEEKQSIKSMIDFELPEEEKQSIKARLETERPREEKQSIKSMIDFELPAEEKQSIKSIIDIELPHEEKANQTDFSADEGRVTADRAPVIDDLTPSAAPETAPLVPPSQTTQPSLAHSEETVSPSYNDRVFNAVSEGWTPPAMGESYGGLSWREVETIYQYSAGGGASGPNMIFEPLAPGQAAGARPTENLTDTNSAATAKADQGNGVFKRSETQPIPPLETIEAASRNETQSPAGNQAAAQSETLPPILKADAPSPKPAASSTFTNLRSRKVEVEPDPPMERTIGQYLGDTDSYLNLDRVTLEPLAEASTRPSVAPPAQAELKPSQEETQTLAGAVQALAAQARAKEAADSQSAQVNPSANHASPQVSNPANAAAIPSAEQGKKDFSNDARWGKRDASATYDSLNALASDSTADVLDLEKLDIFEGMEDIDELRQIEVIEDVIIPSAAESTAKKQKTSDHIPVVSSDDLHDLIKSRIKKAEEPHEPPRVDAFLAHPAPDKHADKTAEKASDKTYGMGAGSQSTASGSSHSSSGAGTSSADTSSTENASTPGANAGGAAAADAPGAVPSAKELEALRQQGRNKFVGGKATTGTPISGAPAAGTDSPIGSSTTTGASSVGGISPRAVPPEIRKACMILGVRPEDMTLKEVNEKWKAQMAAPGVHPDQGGDTESAIYLNTAKDTLVKWINDQAPKLGKKFGKKDEK